MIEIRQNRAKSATRARTEARRVGKLLTKRFIAQLDATMAAAFEDMQAKVPVESRSLKNSARSGSAVRDEGETWIGYAAWGGESAPKAVVDYAVFAMAEGGENDWLRDAPVYNAEFEAMINLHMSRHMRGRP